MKREEVKQVIAEVFGVTEFAEEERFDNLGPIDLFTEVILVQALEEAFDIVISEEYLFEKHPVIGDFIDNIINY